jgi:hypothetical protein
MILYSPDNEKRTDSKERGKTMRTLHIIASQLTEDINPQDEEVAGIYYCQVPEDLDDESACSAALDGFHDTIPVKMLDDFEFSVFDPQTKEFLSEADDAESYAMKGIAKFIEKISDPIVVPDHCYNCDNKATHVIKNVHGNNRGFHTPICDTCKSAYESGQASPHATFIAVEDIHQTV